MKVAHFSFDADLRTLLPAGAGQEDLEVTFQGPQSVKHLVESLGVPHTEIGALVANGHELQLDYQVRDGDRLTVTSIQPPLASETEPRFVLDGHLGRLAAYLRMLGLDCLYKAEAEDRELASDAVREDRVLVTRDRRLLMRKIISRGCLVRSLEPRVQLRQLVARFRLQPWIRPFQRCIRCNHLLQRVPKEEVMDRLEPLTRLYFDDFSICPDCRQIYWKGSHFERMLEIIADLQ